MAPRSCDRSQTGPQPRTFRRRGRLLAAVAALVCTVSANGVVAGPPDSPTAGGPTEEQAAAGGPAAAPVDFAHQVVPVLRRHCAACHGGGEAKGGFSIDTRERFLEGGMADPGSPDFSHFLTFVASPDPALMMPPPEKGRVPAADAALLRRWVEEGMLWEPGFRFGERAYEPPLRPRRVALPPAVDGRTHPIDRLIGAADVPASEPTDDATFLRRASLDLVGLLPTAEEAEAFLANPSPDKRERLVDDLLAREIDYADHWMTFWNDLLRNDYAGTGFITGGRTQISGWLYRALRENRPYDAMVRELVAPADETSAGFINGIEWRGTVSAGQTLPIQFSQSVSQSMLGINMKCASCHDSFIDRWTLADAYGLAAIYSEKPLELYRCDQPTGRTAGPAWPFPEIGQIDGDAPRDERLKQLGDLLTHPENGRVPRTIVNRLWGQLMGRGVVHPLDAMQTEPWNADLLDWLAADFQDHGYDLKRTLRLIATSEAYQSRSLRLESDDPLPQAGSAVPLVKRLTAEQFVDAVWQLTGTAPAQYDAPVDRRQLRDDPPSGPAEASRWVWHASANGGPPPAGEQVVLRRSFTPRGPVRAAVLLAAGDNAIKAALNGRSLLEGDDYTRLERATLSKLPAGESEIVVLGRNGGSGPNPAGVYVSLRILYEDGGTELLVIDPTWEAAPLDAPAAWPIKQETLAELDWSPAAPVSHPAWQAIDPQIRAERRFDPTEPTTRAALLASDPLMRSLGRPNRDQIVTSRPSEVSTLEALDLSTSETLVANLRVGAERMLAASPRPSHVVDDLFLSALTRRPTEEERALIRDYLGPAPDADALTDVMWALLMKPEFLLIR
ncbi:DUF1549 domain-containing protein [Alienimonas californiensis]|uniref:Planctomycete cytochrome C n=1 Tax=Alienimonas californiensis TaxID=2527989 RepID=A0A517PAK2_9PLAN|nr:DUF1549 domain-containing protein [Alienimonas californiensis]QDT16407.1 Planctomycete cytochrome C [Alienimonas californiensis]